MIRIILLILLFILSVLRRVHRNIIEKQRLDSGKVSDKEVEDWIDSNKEYTK